MRFYVDAKSHYKNKRYQLADYAATRFLRPRIQPSKISYKFKSLGLILWFASSGNIKGCHLPIKSVMLAAYYQIDRVHAHQAKKRHCGVQTILCSNT